MVVGISLFATWFYRGMGAKMPPSVLIGPRSLIHDPWFFEMGENVNIGTGAMILGHLGHGKDIILGRVKIRDGAIIGVNAVIFPDVEIGRNARIGAGAIVTRGTIIGEGEVWLASLRENTKAPQGANLQTANLRNELREVNMWCGTEQI